MRLVDFIYDDVNLSDFGMIPCNFSTGDDAMNIGNEMDMHPTKSARSDRYWAIGAQYSSPFTCEFSIIKDPCTGDGVFAMTDEEVNEIAHWLNRRSYKKFIPVYEDGEFADVYYMASFNMSVVTAGGDIVGLNLTMVTDSPYAYFEPEKYKGTLNAATNFSYSFTDNSQEVGYIYPTMVVSLLQKGDLILYNALDETRKTVFYNCNYGEILTFYGDIKQVTSSDRSKVLDEFNYKFPRVINQYGNTVNTFVSNLACKIEITYSPICKIGLII